MIDFLLKYKKIQEFIESFLASFPEFQKVSWGDLELDLVEMFDYLDNWSGFLKTVRFYWKPLFQCTMISVIPFDEPNDFG